tara:strand:- start:1446 stop:1787 length:342 start_codon:yes stop_codon:yes gene_type:complete
MKGFPYSGKSPIKAYNTMDKYSTKAVKFGETKKTPVYQKEEKKGEWKKVEKPGEKKETRDIQYEEANPQERKIMDQMDALNEKMKKIKDKDSKEYKDLENKHRDLDNKLWSFD